VPAAEPPLFSERIPVVFPEEPAMTTRILAAEPPVTLPPVTDVFLDDEPPVIIPDSPAFPLRQLDPDIPMLALTFDDGPTIHTERLLDILSQYEDVRVTFCVAGYMIGNHRSTLRRSAEAGHQIIGHSWSHRNLTTLTAGEVKRELLDTSTLIEEVTGYFPRMFRPPYGAVNDTVLYVAGELEFSVIGWNIDPADWQNKNAEALYDEIMATVFDRGVVLLHDLYASTVDAMERVIPELLEMGYQLVTISELRHYNNTPPY
jgi:peptidoglycan/xylan/chitin deacetylase (PgdA/CDA1 family)